MDKINPEDKLAILLEEIEKRLVYSRTKSTKYLATYEDGYYDALGELDEWIEDNIKGVTNE